jgi:hypothetical protein
MPSLALSVPILRESLKRRGWRLLADAELICGAHITVAVCVMFTG